MRIATLNLRHNQDRWEERLPLVVDSLRQADADVIGLQEVWLEFRQAHVIAEALNQHNTKQPYTVYVEPKWGDNPVEGVGVLSRLPVQSHDRLDLPHEPRVAQRISVEVDGRTVHIANTHLHHRPTHDESIRLPQMQALLHWMVDYSSTGWVLTGDMNALPTSSTIAEAENRLNSAYFTVHQQHPVTFPTPLVTRESYPPVCIDYIFYDAQTYDVQSAQVFADQGHREDKNLYPSDHYGLLADFDLR